MLDIKRRNARTLLDDASSSGRSRSAACHAKTFQIRGRGEWLVPKQTCVNTLNVVLGSKD